MEPIWKGKQTNKTSNTCASDKGKQTNKQTSGGSTCGGADAGGDAELRNMWSLIHNASEYTEELQRCSGDASEKHRVQYTGSYSDSGEISLQKKETGAGVEPKTFRTQCATKEPLPVSQQTVTPNSL